MKAFLCGFRRVGLLAALAVTPAAYGQAGNNLDQALALLAEARQAFQTVRDYECQLHSRERVNGKLLPENVMTMRGRTGPYSVYLSFESPDSERGLQVCYVEGRNRGMMRVHPTGLRGVFGFWSVDPRDPRVFEKSRHALTEAGLGQLLDGTARYWEIERQLNATQVRITEEELYGRTCTRIETIHPDRGAGTFYGYRCVLWLDKATHLPAGAEAYDWPREGGPEGGDLLEAYRYVGLRCNVGLSDGDFPE